MSPKSPLPGAGLVALAALFSCGEPVGQDSAAAPLQEASARTSSDRLVATETARRSRFEVVGRYLSRPEALPGDVSYLESLAARYASRGVRVVVVACSPAAPGVERLRSCDVVFADVFGAETAWRQELLADGGRITLSVDAGPVAFSGSPGCGLVDALDRALSNTDDAEDQRRARTWRARLSANYDDLESSATVRLLVPMVEQYPRDGLLQGLLYLTLATKANDVEAARASRVRAVEAMSDSPRALAVFADLALRGDPFRREVARDLRPVLETAATQAPEDPRLLLALLRALVVERDARAVGRLAMVSRTAVSRTFSGCLDYAMTLASAQTPEVHRYLAESAIQQADQLGADARSLAAARYVVTLRCAADARGAAALLDAYLREQDDIYSSNNDAWGLLTDLQTLGRFDLFALGLVSPLLADRPAMDYFELDTAALAMFRAGRLAEAIELQGSALQQGGRQEVAYRARMARYLSYSQPAAGR